MSYGLAYEGMGLDLVMPEEFTRKKATLEQVALFKRERFNFAGQHICLAHKESFWDPEWYRAVWVAMCSKDEATKGLREEALSYFIAAINSNLELPRKVIYAQYFRHERLLEHLLTAGCDVNEDVRKSWLVPYSLLGGKDFLKFLTPVIFDLSINEGIKLKFAKQAFCHSVIFNIANFLRFFEQIGGTAIDKCQVKGFLETLFKNSGYVSSSHLPLSSSGTYNIVGVHIDIFVNFLFARPKSPGFLNDVEQFLAVLNYKNVTSLDSVSEYLEGFKDGWPVLEDIECARFPNVVNWMQTHGCSDKLPAIYHQKASSSALVVCGASGAGAGAGAGM